MSEIARPPVHRVGAAIGAARAALGSVAGAPVWSMTAEETTAALDEVAACEAQLREVKSRLLVQAEAVEAPGSMSTPNWLARRYQLTRPEAHRQARLATGLDTHPTTAAALADARVNAEQALAIVSGVDALPADLDPDLVEKAEVHLIGLAGEYDAKSLKGFARTILEVVAERVNFSV